MQILENIQTLSDFLTKETYLILENRFRNKPRPIRRTVYKVSTDIVKYNSFRLPCFGNETVIAFYDEGNDIEPIMFGSTGASYPSARSSTRSGTSSLTSLRKRWV